MADVLHFELPSKQLYLALNEISRSLKEINESKIYGNAQAFKLNLANSIWGQEGYEYKSGFLELLLSYYGIGLKLQDFMQSPDKARQEINRWVSKETEKKIQDLIPAGGINDMTRLVLANAIYFYASWATPFWENSTKDEDFFLLDGGNVKIPMMKMVEYISYHKGSGFQAVRLPYVGERFSMFIILPDIKRFTKFENQMNIKVLNQIPSKVKRRKVELTLPKFNFDSTFSLKETLASLGMNLAFSGKADFSGMVATEKLFIHNVFHKAYITVDEKGTEAAAATAVLPQVVAYGFRIKEKVYKFNANHPFIFFIYDSVTGSILFLGKVLNPSIAGR